MTESHETINHFKPAVLQILKQALTKSTEAVGEEFASVSTQTIIAIEQKIRRGSCGSSFSLPNIQEKQTNLHKNSFPLHFNHPKMLLRWTFLLCFQHGL